MMEVPDWKVHLLERKRKEEEEMKRREREEDERLAKMPPWKREIILRRKAKAEASMLENKTETEGEQEEKIGGGGEEEEKESRVLRENIGPVQKNPFIQQEKQRRIPEYSCTRPKSTTEQTVQRIPKVDDLVRDTNLPNDVKEQDSPLEEHQPPSVDVKGRVSRLLSRFGGSRTEDDSDPCLQRVNGEEGVTKTVLPTTPVIVEPETQVSSIANPAPPSPSCFHTATGNQTLTQETILSTYVTPSSSSVESEPSELSTCAAPMAMSGFTTRQSMTDEVRPFPFHLRPASPSSPARLKQATQVSPILSRPETFKVNAGKTDEDGETGLSPSKVTCNFQAIKRTTGENQAVQRRKGNTITVNPRKVAVCENGYAVTEAKSPGTKPESGKKRYPTAEEIKVIGGYLALSRSCLAKHSQDKKKMNISFPEADLESTFEYPSESSMLAEYGPAEEPDVPVPPLAQPEDDEEEESALLGGILRRKALLVDESCKR